MSELAKPYPLPQTRAELYDSFRHARPVDPDSYRIVAGNGNKKLFDQVGELLDVEVTYPNTSFPNGETKTKIQPNVRLTDVFVLQSMSPNPNDRMAELIFMGDTIMRSDAIKSRLVFSKIGYDRQDRRAESRTPVSIAALADLLHETGNFKSLFSIDIHNEASMGSFRGPWDNAHASRVLVPAIQALGIENPVIVAPDAGSGKRAEDYSNGLGGADLGMVYKQRTKERNEVLFLAGDVDGRNVILPDDVGATGKSIINAARRVKDAGAKQVVAAVTHLENVRDEEDKLNFLDRLSAPDCPLDLLLTTDTIFQADDHERMQIVSVAPIMAVALLCYLTGESMGQRLYEPRAVKPAPDNAS